MPKRKQGRNRKNENLQPKKVQKNNTTKMQKKNTAKHTKKGEKVKKAKRSGGKSGK